jgi:hypothetical protein
MLHDPCSFLVVQLGVASIPLEASYSFADGNPVSQPRLLPLGFDIGIYGPSLLSLVALELLSDSLFAAKFNEAQ